MRLLARILVTLLSVMVWNVSVGVITDIVTGRPDPWLQAIFGLLGGAVVWLLMGKRKGKKEG